MLYVALNAVLAGAVVGAVVGLLTWSVFTQHRDFACEKLRVIRWRVRFSVERAASDQPEPGLTTYMPGIPAA